MARKSRFFKSDSLKNESPVDDFLKPSDDALFSKEDFPAELFSEDELGRSFLDDEKPLASVKDFFDPSAPPEPRASPSIAIGWTKKSKLLKIFLISGGAIALLLLALRTGNYLFTNFSLVNQPPTETTNNPIASLSDLSRGSPESTLPTVSPFLSPAPEENKNLEPIASVKLNKSPPKIGKKPQPVTHKKAGKSAARVYELYIKRKFILGEARAISLKLSLLGIENKIVKRKDGGYTIFVGTFQELSKAKQVRSKILSAGYQVGIYSVVKN
jgi:hypothetical protein